MKLNYFKDKVCTILTTFTGHGQIDPSDNGKVFSGTVVSEDENGFWLQEVMGTKMSYFYKKFIVGILEETTVSPEQVKIEGDEITFEFLDDFRKKI